MHAVYVRLAGFPGTRNTYWGPGMNHIWLIWYFAVLVSLIDVSPFIPTIWYVCNFEETYLLNVTRLVLSVIVFSSVFKLNI